MFLFCRMMGKPHSAPQDSRWHGTCLLGTVAPWGKRQPAQHRGHSNWADKKKKKKHWDYSLEDDSALGKDYVTNRFIFQKFSFYIFLGNKKNPTCSH